MKLISRCLNHLRVTIYLICINRKNIHTIIPHKWLIYPGPYIKLIKRRIIFRQNIQSFSCTSFQSLWSNHPTAYIIMTMSLSPIILQIVHYESSPLKALHPNHFLSTQAPPPYDVSYLYQPALPLSCPVPHNIPHDSNIIRLNEIMVSDNLHYCLHHYSLK